LSYTECWKKTVNDMHPCGKVQFENSILLGSCAPSRGVCCQCFETM